MWYTFGTITRLKIQRTVIKSKQKIALPIKMKGGSSPGRNMAIFEESCRLSGWSIQQFFSKENLYMWGNGMLKIGMHFERGEL